MTLSRSVPTLSLLALFLLGACRKNEPASPAPAPTPSPAPQSQKTVDPVAEARRAFQTQLKDAPTDHEPAPPPPPGVFEKVMYPAPLGNNVAYVTPVREGPRRSAVLWIQGGFNWGIDASAWEARPRSNDQSARAFREAGLVMMMPALRGCSGNPGSREYFLGEVDDVLAALEFLARRPDVDPERIYLGGHSTGGTMALLAAASGPRVRGVFAFGPVAVSYYGETGTALDRAEGKELAIRSPVVFMEYIRVPTLILEGEKGNTFAFDELREASKDAPVRFVAVPGGTHFNILAPLTELLAQRIARNNPAEPPTSLSEQDAVRAMRAEATAH
ncbi:alpha/beta hydrolase family protein [Archangium lansingense]|uniref:Alpha/beta fold hydrolase n=1 Tax=Archangium lansingense TaxID=2995310 RepID=A0ABT4AI10_9BACT|nr:prolyl oligopeptidase family serine peptidase [Archangium lansinium]MCY1081308.1 alpha/beta fold hydrolase [Archangium lansinium]